MSETYPPEPPPLDYDEFEAPEAYDPTLDYVPFGIPDDYIPDDFRNLPDVPPPSQDGLQGFESPEPEDEAWSWHDARIIGIDHGDNRYEIGAIDLYANADTGDLGGSYLPIATFSDEAPAIGYYHQLQQEIHEQGMPAYHVADFAERQAFAMNPEPENWRGAEPDEYAAYDYIRDLEAFDPALADLPSDDAIDPLIQTAIELGGVVVEKDMDQPKIDEATFRALDAIGVQAENFDLTTNPPPFYDTDTGTAYWIGVFQPDKDDRENCVTSILSLGRDPETGEMEAQLAPCVPGDWDKTYSAAEYLIQTANRGGIEQLFDTAEGMALATDQRELWETERGVPLADDATRAITDFTQWEVER